MKIRIRNYFILLLTLSQISCNQMKKEADLIVYNGHVYTVDDAFTTTEAFVVKDGMILETGTNQQIMKTYQADHMLDVDGRAVYPGFIDGHCHFYGYGENLYRYADLTGCQSVEEMVKRLEAHVAANPSDFILGRGWDHNLWNPAEYPDNELLEQHFPEKKILLIRVDGHASLASKTALTAAGITAKTKVAGGEILLNKRGEPSGMLIDKADEPVRALIQPLSQSEKQQALIKAQKNCFAVGLSSVVDAGLPYTTIELIRKMHEDGALKMKINAMIDPDEETLNYYLPKGKQFDDRLSVTAVKMYADGALGSRGARMMKPYSDAPEKHGLMLFDDSFYRQVAQRAYEAGFQVNMHAIGDEAVRYVLDLYGDLLQKTNDRRWRIEHAQIVHPDDFAKFGRFNIIPSIQSTHATSDMRWAIHRIGPERLKGAYAQQQLLQQNGWLINGTDFPIEGINPLVTFYAAVVRKDAEGYPDGGFQMENALSREQALRSMTIWAAKGSFEEDKKGSIEPGKAADFVILDRDIMLCDEGEITDSEVLMLYVNGEQVYRNE